jgi:hypothetical protein
MSAVYYLILSRKSCPENTVPKILCYQVEAAGVPETFMTVWFNVFIQVTVVLQWCYSGGTVVLEWCYSCVRVVLKLCHRGFIVLLQAKIFMTVWFNVFIQDTVVLQWCCSGVTVVVQLC